MTGVTARGAGGRSASKKVEKRGREEGENSEEDHEPEDVAEDRKESGRRFLLGAQPWIPWDASQRSASIAALQPSPAADTAWR